MVLSSLWSWLWGPEPNRFAQRLCLCLHSWHVPDICTRLGAPLTSVDRCASSSQTTYRSFPYCTRKLTHFVAPPLPEKSFGLFGNPVMLPSSSAGRGRVCCSGNPSVVGSNCLITRKTLRPKRNEEFFGTSHRFRYQHKTIR